MNSLLPFTQWPVQGGDSNRLYQSLVHNQPAQAMLLVGDDRETDILSRFVAKTLLCQSETDLKPCGTCADCRQFEAGAHPNWHETETDGKSLKTQAVEALQAFLTRRAHGDNGLVYLVPHMDRATPVAANRLLKTLEDPAGDFVALLTAENIRQVLPTILSRCFVYRIGVLLPQPETGFESPVANEDESPKEISSFAALRERVVQWTGHFLSRSVPAVVLANDLFKLKSEEADDAILDGLLEWLHHLMTYALSKRISPAFSSYQEATVRQTACVSGSALAEMIQIVLQAKMRTGAHVGAQLNFEQMCIRMRRVVDGLHGSGSPV